MSMNTGDTTVIRRPTFLPGGRTVAAERGWAWIAEGWNLFKQAPGLWIGMIVVLAVILIVLGIIPVAGAIATIILQPVLGAGLVIASAKLDQGETPQFSDLFAGFQTQFGRLAALGGLYLAGSAVIFLGFVLIGGAGALSMAHSGEASPAAVTAFLLALLVALALLVPLMMAFWFAVPLTLFHDQGALGAIKGSFGGCLRNILPFLVYGVIGMLLAILASVPLGLGWLVLGPVLAASVYTGYKDIYLSS
ncbi:MAG TPA: BPSS1780 family membrane protein [Burkholderiales bacterium]